MADPSIYHVRGFDFKIQNKGRFDLHHLTDLQVGAPDFDEAAFKERVELIKADPWAYWTFGGDGADLISHKDRRFHWPDLPHRYRNYEDLRAAAMDHLVELLDPIKEKMLLAIEGNHEHKFDAHHGGNFCAEMCYALGQAQAWAGSRGFFRLSFECKGSGRRVSGIGLVEHGWRGGRSEGSFHSGAPAMLATWPGVNWIFIGHNHKPDAYGPMPQFVPNRTGSKMVPVDRCVINGGAWTRGYNSRMPISQHTPLAEVPSSGTYAERKGFNPTRIGGPVLRLTVDAGYAATKTGGVSREPKIHASPIKGEINAETLGL